GLADDHLPASMPAEPEVLSSALHRAMREELIIRNVVRMVELPQSQREAIEPWTAEEARCFLLASRKHPCTQHSSCWFCTVAPRRNAGAAPGRADIGS